jgi:hypothetical protein
MDQEYIKKSKFLIIEFAFDRHRIFDNANNRNKGGIYQVLNICK